MAPKRPKTSARAPTKVKSTFGPVIDKLIKAASDIHQKQAA
jgi:hypothetical protein